MSNRLDRERNMKKLLYLASLALTISACKKEDIPSPAEIIGSSWTYHADASHYETISILDAASVQVTGNLTGNYYSKDGTYTYQKSGITIYTKTEFLLGSVTESMMIVTPDPLNLIYPPGYSMIYARD